MKHLEDLNTAYAGSFYTILGAGGPLEDWENSVNEALEEQGIGTPAEWYSTNGGAVNHFMADGGRLAPNDDFPSDLVILLFPLDGLDVGKLAMFKLRMEDRWFDDVVDNVRRRRLA